MEFIVPVICGLLVVFGLVAIVMSRSNWRIPQMILLSFILIGSLAFFYLAARTLKTHENFQTELTLYQKSIDLAQNGDPSKGDLGREGIAQLTEDRNKLKQEVAEAMAERGRVWPGAIRNKVDRATGTITASFDQPPFDQAPQGLEPKSVVFVFEDVDKGKYLGEFTVVSVNVAGKQATLTPAGTLVPREYELIGNSKGPWIFYEIMPTDSDTLFAELEPDALKALLPVSSLDEYSRDGKAAKDSDPKDRVRVRVKFTKVWPETAVAPAAAAVPAGNPAEAAKPVDSNSFRPGDLAYFDPDTAKDLVETKRVADYDASDLATARIYVRPLRDYARLFREAYRERSELIAQRAETAAQVQQVESAVKQVGEDIKAAGTEKEGLAKDLAKFKLELDAVVAFKQSLDAKLAKTRATLSELFRSNVRLSAQLTDVEKKLAEVINRQAPPAETSASLGR